MCIRTVTYMCRKGHYYTDKPPADIQSSTGWCHPCPDGSFMDSEEHSQGQCKQCLKCYSEENQYYKKRCNRNDNSECEMCPQGMRATQEGYCHSPTTTTVATTTTNRTTSKTTKATTESSTARPSTTASGSPAHSTIQATSTTASLYNRLRNLANTMTSEKITTELPATSYAATNVDSWNVANASNLEEDGELPIDGKVAPLATLSALSTVAFLLLLLLFCVKMQKRRRSGSCALRCCSKQRMSCVDHVYAEPYDYDQPIYLDVGVGSSGASSSQSSHFYSSIYDCAQTAASLLEDGYERPGSLCRCCQRDGDIGDATLCRQPITTTEATLEGNDIVAEDITAGQSGSPCRGCRDYAQNKAEWQVTASLSVGDRTQCGSLPF